MKLLDFGLAKHYPDSRTDGMTTTMSRLSASSTERFTTCRRSSCRELHASITAAISMPSGSCSIKWPPARVPSTSSRRSALMAAIQLQPHIPLRQLAPHHPRTAGADRRHAPGEGSTGSVSVGHTLRAELDVLRRGTRPAAAALGDPRRPCQSRCCRSTSSGWLIPRPLP